MRVPGYVGGSRQAVAGNTPKSFVSGDPGFVKLLATTQNYQWWLLTIAIETA
jgi:hypothetical protein